MDAKASTISADVEAFLEHCRERVANREMSPATVNRGYALSLQKILLPFCDRQSITTVAELDGRMLSRLSAELHGRNLSRASVATYLRSINQFLTWRGIHERDLRARLPKRMKVVRDVLSYDEMRQLEDAAPTARDQLIIRLMSDRGLREGEIANLRTQDVTTRAAEPFLMVRGKTGERAVPLYPELYDRIRSFIARTRPKALTNRVFLSSRRKAGGDWIPLSEEGIYQVVKDAAARTNWTRRIYPHLLRHSAISRFAAEGKLHPAYIAEIFGVSIEVIAQHYIHPSDRDLYAAMKRADSRDD